METVREKKPRLTYLIKFYDRNGKLDTSSFHTWEKNAEMKALECIARLSSLGWFVSFEIVDEDC